MTDAFATVVRLMWIDDLIDEEGHIQRGDITRAFRMSVPQASHDLRRYMQLNPPEETWPCHIHQQQPVRLVSAKSATPCAALALAQ